MNEQDIADVQSTVKGVMSKYLFETMSEVTIKNITNDIASSIEIKDLYDYLIKVNPDVDNNGFNVDVCIKDSINEEFKYFNASLTAYSVGLDEVDSLEFDTKITDYERAMEIING